MIAKTEFKADEKAITKIQDFQVSYMYNQLYIILNKILCRSLIQF